MSESLISILAKDVDMKFRKEIKRCISKMERPVGDRELMTFARHFLFAGFYYGKNEADRIALQHKHFSKRDIFFYMAILLNVISVIICSVYFTTSRVESEKVRDSIQGSAIQQFHIANNEGEENQYIYVSSFEFKTEDEAKKMQEYVLRVKEFH